MVLKLDNAGEFMWSKTYGGQGNDIGKDIIQTSDGGYIITGYTKSYSSGGDSDLWLIKTNANGESCLYSEGGTCSESSSKWVRTFGTSGNDYGNSVKETSEGDFIVTGKSGRIPSIFVVKQILRAKKYGRTYMEIYQTLVIEGILYLRDKI